MAQTRKRMIILFLAAATVCTLAAVFFVLFLFRESPKELFLKPELTRTLEKTRPASPPAEVGTGWSAEEDPRRAVQAALDMALRGKTHRRPDLLILFVTGGVDLRGILREARGVVGPATKIFGGTHDQNEVLTPGGVILGARPGSEPGRGPLRAVTVMTISSEHIAFGVGSADYSAYPSVRAAARAAVLEAIRSAGKQPSKAPNVILLSPTPGREDEAISGIEEITGKKVPMLGGTAGGEKRGVVGNNNVYSAGISLVAAYTDLPVGWTYESGFDVTAAETGTVTKVKGNHLIEIDHRPAWDVYDEWLDGKISELAEKDPENWRAVNHLLSLNPLYRRFQAPSGEVYFLFTHPHPLNNSLKTRGISVGTPFRPGERIHLSHGTWETLVNRIGNLPRAAKARGGFDVSAKPLFGIGYVCSGIMTVIPESERRKVPLLVDYSISQAPFILTFTWGEQGLFPEIGNKHGNLLTSFLVVGEKTQKGDGGRPGS